MQSPQTPRIGTLKLPLDEELPDLALPGLDEDCAEDLFSKQMAFSLDFTTASESKKPSDGNSREGSAATEPGASCHTLLTFHRQRSKSFSSQAPAMNVYDFLMFKKKT
mgnify:CR=1 FL=1